MRYIWGNKIEGYCIVHLGRDRSVILLGVWKLLYLRSLERICDLGFTKEHNGAIGFVWNYEI